MIHTLQSQLHGGLEIGDSVNKAMAQYEKWILHLLTTSKFLSKDRQDNFIDPYADLFCSPCA